MEEICARQCKAFEEIQYSPEIESLVDTIVVVAVMINMQVQLCR